MAKTTQEDENMPYFMESEYFWEGIRFFKGINDGTNSIEKTSQCNPIDCIDVNVMYQGWKHDNTQPAHPKIKGCRKPAGNIDPNKFYDDSYKRQCPNGCKYPPLHISV